jgi:hypothetical protein
VASPSFFFFSLYLSLSPLSLSLSFFFLSKSDATESPRQSNRLLRRVAELAIVVSRKSSLPPPPPPPPPPLSPTIHHHPSSIFLLHIGARKESGCSRQQQLTGQLNFLWWKNRTMRGKGREEE